MKRALSALIFGLLTAACASEPYYPTQPPAPIRKPQPGVIYPPSKKPSPPVPTEIALPSGKTISVVEDTVPLPDCGVFGITGPNAICIAVPAAMADGRGGGKAQSLYAERMRNAGYIGRDNSMELRNGTDCRQHVMLSTLPAAATQSDDWNGVKDYVVFIEFTKMSCR